MENSQTGRGMVYRAVHLQEFSVLKVKLRMSVLRFNVQYIRPQ